jgi:hypothetical protein
MLFTLLLGAVIPAVNLILLLGVIYRLQQVRAELDARTKRFEHIERQLTELQKNSSPS